MKSGISIFAVIVGLICVVAMIWLMKKIGAPANCTKAEFLQYLFRYVSQLIRPKKP